MKFQFTSEISLIAGMYSGKAPVMKDAHIWPKPLDGRFVKMFLFVKSIHDLQTIITIINLCFLGTNINGRILTRNINIKLTISPTDLYLILECKKRAKMFLDALNSY